MNTGAFELELFLGEVFYGLGVMCLVAIFDIYAFIEISLTYTRILDRAKFRNRHYEMLRFIGFIMLIVIAMLLSLFFWVLALTIFNFAPDWFTAILFAASFFTSVGNFTINLPFGWRLVPSMIAFSGLFSFAWATACSMHMARTLFLYLEKNKKI